MGNHLGPNNQPRNKNQIELEQVYQQHPFQATCIETVTETPS